MNGFCKMSCTDLTVPYKKYYCRKGSLVSPVQYEDIMQELMDNGPMQVGFIIYTDFTAYSSGIYYALSPYIAGAHAVKLIGWKYDDNDRLYWIC